MAGRWRGTLPTTRAPDQPAIDTVFPKKKKQRVKDNASDLRPAPAGHDDEPEPKPAPTAMTPNKADGDFEMLTCKSPGGTIEIIDSPEPKSEGDKVVQSKAMDLIDVDEPPIDGRGGESELYCEPKKTPELVEGFDMAKSVGDKVVEPQAMEVFDIFKDKKKKETESIPRFSRSLFPEGTNGRAAFGLNYELDLAPLIDAKNSEVAPAIELFKDKQSERLGVKKSDLIIKVGATSKEPELMCRHLDNWTYPKEIFLPEPFALCIGISSDIKVRTIEDHGWYRTDSTNKIRSGGLDRAWLNITISPKTPGLVYVMTAKKEFTTVRSVHDALRKLHCERINTEDAEQAKAESRGLQFRQSAGYFPRLLQTLLVTVDDQAMPEVHVCFTKKGPARLNEFCRSRVPEVMELLNRETFVWKGDYPKLVDVYCEVFPDKRETAMTMHGNTTHDEAIPLAEKLRDNTPCFVTRAEVDKLIAGGTKYPIKLQRNNPKKLGTLAGQLYFDYQSAQTVAEMRKKGARKEDIQDCFVKGYLKLVEAEPRASDIPDCFKGFVKKPP